MEILVGLFGTVFVAYLIFAIIVGAVAGAKGRSFIGWTVISLLITPLIALIIVLASGDQRKGNMSIEQQMRDAAIKERCRPYIRSHKPPFSNGLVYDCTVGGISRRFKSEVEALHFVSAELGRNENYRIAQG